MSRLDDLQKEIEHTLKDVLIHPEPWLPDQPGIAHNVLIVGAGQSGCAAAFALRRQGIEATIIDVEEEGHEGVWLNRARMPTLRTPKDRPGPELGIPSLSFKAWHTALEGAAAYAKIDRVPRTVWAAYLKWFRSTLGLSVRFQTRLTNIAPHGQNLRVTLEELGERRTEIARKVVLAGGLTAGGTMNIPRCISDNIPRSYYAHTNELIEFASLRGKSIGVLGASASGFDAAATALEAGATNVHLFCRSSDLARGTRYRWADYPGADYFHLLPDADRWRIASLYLERGNHPPPSSIARVASNPNFKLHLGSPWNDCRHKNHSVQVVSNTETFEFDFVIAATGFTHDPSRCVELSEIASQIAIWQDRYTPPPEEQNPNLALYPYLGPEFQYQEKHTGAAPYIRNIHVLNTAALLSHLRIVGDIKCLGYTSDRLAAGIVRDLFLADRSHHLQRLSSPIRPELTGQEYEAAIWKPVVTR